MRAQAASQALRFRTTTAILLDKLSTQRSIDMAIGDGIRRNVAHVSAAERQRLRDAIIELNSRKYLDNVSKWVKQDEIHQATHVHRGPAFIPWHRELCNRFELLLREVDAELSLHYWDWTEDPRQASDGAGGKIDLLMPNFMGTPSGPVGVPFTGFPPFDRKVKSFSPGIVGDSTIIDSTNGVVQEDQWKTFRETLEPVHDTIHRYIGGSIGNQHTAFEGSFRIPASFQRGSSLGNVAERGRTAMAPRSGTSLW